MYISGDFNSYESRLHAFCTSEADFYSYVYERETYNNLPRYIIPRWDREELRQRMILGITGSPPDYEWNNLSGEYLELANAIPVSNDQELELFENSVNAYRELTNISFPAIFN